MRVKKPIASRLSAQIGDIVRIKSSLRFNKYRNYISESLFSKNLILVSFRHVYIYNNDKEVPAFKCVVMNESGEISSFCIEKMSSLIRVTATPKTMNK